MYSTVVKQYCIQSATVAIHYVCSSEVNKRVYLSTPKTESTFIKTSNEYECLTLDIKAFDGLVMGYYDGNKVTELWKSERHEASAMMRLTLELTSRTYEAI